MATTLSERGWKGLATNASPHDIPAGSALVQNNLLVVSPGILRCRRGVVPLPWSLTPADSQPVIVAVRFDTQLFSFVVYQRADGSIKAAQNGSTQTIGSGAFHAGYPMSAVRTRQGKLIFANGIDWVRRWDGLASIDYVGIEMAPNTPGLALGSGGALSAGAYQWAVRYVDESGLASPLSVVASGTATANQGATVTFPMSDQLGNNSSLRVVTIELWRTTVGETITFYRVATTANTGSGNASFTDHTSDATLIANALATPSLALPVTNPDGSVNARRQGMPPTGKPFLALFQNRVFGYGTTTYNTGTVHVTNGSAAVTGTSTSWPTLFSATLTQSPWSGRLIRFGSDTTTYQIASVSNSTSMTLTTNYLGSTASGVTYTVLPAPGDVRGLCYSEPDEPESWPATNVVGVQNNTGDNDAETGIMPFNSMLYLLHERHVYQATYVEQGTIIITVQLVTNRGCVNNRAWVIAGDTAYLLDQFGIYSFDGRSPNPISEPIQDLFINGTLDWTKKQYWFASYDPVERVVRFHVHYTGDSGNQPTRTLTWVPSTQTWSTDTYPMGLGAACRTDVSGQNRLLFGGVADNLLLSGQGLSDVVTTAITGTLTSGGSTTTLTDSGASFTSATIGAPVAITRGAAKGQVGIVTANTGTTLTVSGITSAPAAGDTYAVGAIQYDYMTGRHQFIDNLNIKDVAVARAAVLAHASTTNNATLDVRRYENHDATPKYWQPGTARHNGVAYDQNGPNAVVNLKLGQFPAGNDPGYKEIDFPGAFGGPLAPRWIAFELAGFQTLDAIQLYALDLWGIQP